jgi:polyisoprenoid-binding protein YceI
MTTQPRTSFEQLTGDYDLDPSHTRIGFAARHAMVATVHGRFGIWSGNVHLDGADPSKSSAEILIDASSIDTSNDQRDGHLRSPDFLDVANHPTITFRSTGVYPVDAETFRMTGDLAIRGTTRPVTIELEYQGAATDPFGNFRVGFEGKSVINRKDWGLVWNATLETGGVLVGDKVKLEFDLSAIKKT